MKCLILLLIVVGATACSLRLKPNLDPFYSAALKQNPGNAAALFSQGEFLIRQGRYETALKYFQRLVKAAPKQSKGWFGLGRCFFELHDYSAAKSAFEHCLELAPSQEGYLGLASAALMNGQIGDARELAEKIERQYGSSAALLHLKGDIAYFSGDYAAALKFYRESHKLNPTERGIQEHIRDLEDFLASTVG